MHKSDIEEPTWGMALRVWWAWIWRTWLLSFLAFILYALVAATLLSFLSSLDNLLGNLFSFIISLGWFALGIIVGVYIVKRLMEKGFGRYRLQVVKKEDF